MAHHGEIPEFRRRYRYLVAAVVLTFLVLIGRLWQLQIVEGGHYRRRSENNFVQERSIRTVRGPIYDRRRVQLASNRPSFDVYVTARFVDEGSRERLIRELGLDVRHAAAVRKRIESVSGQRRFQRLLLLRDISRDQLARFETNKSVLHGFSVVAVTHRSYLHGNVAAHVLGYMNEISAAELLSRDREGIYEPGDLVGRFGVERKYEGHLRGVPGSARVVVDARGIVNADLAGTELLRPPLRREPQPGHRLVLTIDLELQRLVERALRRYPSGAAVVMEAETGRILASASRPGFDPNVLTGRLSPKEARRLLDDPYRPLLDKAFREHYFPGSTYKVVTAAAAVEEGVVTWDEEVECKGWHHFGRRTFRCSHVHKDVALHAAIVGSCNVYFYTLAERIGMDRIARYARMFGLGAATGVGLNGEVGGFIPTKDWYRQQGRPFRIGFTLNAAIGQGNVKVTPVQVATLYAAIGNGGKLYLPQIVEAIETASGKQIHAFRPRLRRRVAVRPQTLDRIRSALDGVVNDPKGTAYEARLDLVRVAGKTGTAQVTHRGKKKTYWLTDHSWFAGYAPADSPQIAVAVLIEHGGRAAKVAAPVAMEIIKGYFKYVDRLSLRSQGPATEDASGRVP